MCLRTESRGITSEFEKLHCRHTQDVRLGIVFLDVKLQAVIGFGGPLAPIGHCLYFLLRHEK
jgi:hypothetical protein